MSQGKKKAPTPADVAAAVSFLKLHRPDLWEKLKQSELEDEGFISIAGELRRALWEFEQSSQGPEIQNIDVRRAIRTEMGLSRVQPRAHRTKPTNPNAPLRTRFSPEQIDSAVQLIKGERPDLWARFREHELKDEGFTDIVQELITLLNQLRLTNALPEMTDLLRQVRATVRRELGLWVPNVEERK